MMCLPPGKYFPQKDDLVAIATEKVDTLTLPTAPGWGFHVHWRPAIYSSSHGPFHYRGRKSSRTDASEIGGLDEQSSSLHNIEETNDSQEDEHDEEEGDFQTKLDIRDDYQAPDLNPDIGITEHEYRTPQSGNKYFNLAMESIGLNIDGEAWFQVLAPDDGPKPVCCLFSEVNFGGNVFCAGEGGGDVPESKLIDPDLSHVPRMCRLELIVLMNFVFVCSVEKQGKQYLMPRRRSGLDLC